VAVANDDTHNPMPDRLVFFVDHCCAKPEVWMAVRIIHDERAFEKKALTRFGKRAFADQVTLPRLRFGLSFVHYRSPLFRIGYHNLLVRPHRIVAPNAIK
jgi:hypothetical protein